MNWVIIGWGNGLSPARRQANAWTNAGLLSVELLETYFDEIWIGILSFSFEKMKMKMPTAKMAAIFPGGDELTNWGVNKIANFLQSLS